MDLEWQYGLVVPGLITVCVARCYQLAYIRVDVAKQSSNLDSWQQKMPR